MNAKEWAARLNGREYLKELTSAEEEQAKADGVVIVFGASDDLIEFRGVINYEDGAWNGGSYRVNLVKEVLRLSKYCDDHLRALPAITAVWSPKDAAGKTWTSWLISASIPAYSFDIMEDGKLYCRGIVFAWTDAFPTKEQETEKARETAINDFRMDELDAVMLSVDKWLTGDQLKNNPATRAADAREVALRAIEREATRANLMEAARYQFRARLAALESIATAVDADIDAGRPLEYNVEHLRDELIRARGALGILPEQDAVRPKEGHDAQYPGRLYDPAEIRSPLPTARCLIHPVPPGLEALTPEELADGAAVDCLQSGIDGNEDRRRSR